LQQLIAAAAWSKRGRRQAALVDVPQQGRYHMAETEHYRCKECGVEFNTPDQLQQHTNQEHKTETQQAGQRESRQGQSRTEKERRPD
jgi:hypothetical protein